MDQQLRVIQESNNDHIQDLISKINSTTRFIDKKGNVLKKRRDTLLNILKDLRDTDTKLADSKISCSTAIFSSIQDDSDFIHKLYEEIAHKDQQIQELKDQIETLTNKLKNSQACNEEMQYQLQQKKQSQYQRVNKLSQSMIVPSLLNQNIEPKSDNPIQTITNNSTKSTENSNSKEEIKKIIRRVSMQAAASAHILAAKGDYVSLQVAHDEMLSQKSFGSQKSLSFK
ncbi:unnamed protein product [Paramecium sonneborni]|uniref:Uncharacterized protein n=1 Tax=Paramecium sonneborni TaxID=65129 RepID=A0A8S1KN50_9CILI|nr:unnamed protein product [Paramecium sonneborni]